MLQEKKNNLKKSIRKNKFKLSKDTKKYDYIFDNLMFSNKKLYGIIDKDTDINSDKDVNTDKDINYIISKIINDNNSENFLINLQIILIKLESDERDEIDDELLEKFIIFLTTNFKNYKKYSNENLLIFWNWDKILFYFPKFFYLLDNTFFINLFSYYDNNIIPETIFYILNLLSNYILNFQKNENYLKELKKIFLEHLFIKKIFNYFDKFKFLLKIKFKELYIKFLETFIRYFNIIYLFLIPDVEIKFLLLNYMLNILKENNKFSVYFVKIIYIDFILNKNLIQNTKYFDFFINNYIQDLLLDKNIYYDEDNIYKINKIFEFLILNLDNRIKFNENFKMFILKYIFSENFKEFENDLKIISINILNSYIYYFSGIDNIIWYFIQEKNLWINFLEIFKNTYNKNLKEQIMIFFFYIYYLNTVLKDFIDFNKLFEMILEENYENFNQKCIYYFNLLLDLYKSDGFDLWNLENKLIEFYDNKTVKNIWKN